MQYLEMPLVSDVLNQKVFVTHRPQTPFKPDLFTEQDAPPMYPFLEGLTV